MDCRLPESDLERSSVGARSSCADPEGCSVCLCADYAKKDEKEVVVVYYVGSCYHTIVAAGIHHVHAGGLRQRQSDE